jgi:hydrogenase maturation protease
MSDAPQLLILGLGNVLCADDGVGAAAVTRLVRERRVPEAVAVLDGGTLGLSLLPLVESVPDVILVDAVRTDAAPGTLVRLDDDEVLPAARDRLSPHQIGVADLLDAMRLRARSPRRLVLLGLVPESLELRLGRSPDVEAALPTLVDAIVAAAAELGHALPSRGADETSDRADAADVARVLGL